MGLIWSKLAATVHDTSAGVCIASGVETNSLEICHMYNRLQPHPRPTNGMVVAISVCSFSLSCRRATYRGTRLVQDVHSQRQTSHV